MAKRPPEGLSRTAAQFFRQVQTDYALDPHDSVLLRLACECLTRMEEARAAVEKDGAYFTNREGIPRPHPALAVERDSRAAFARLVNQLGLDDDPPAGSSPAPARVRRR